jgi:hypothetical protein
MLFSMTDEEEEEQTLDPVSHLLDEESDEPSSNPLQREEASYRAETKKILTEAGPSAARRLSRIATSGEDKDASGAASAILDRIGFEKGSSDGPKASQSLLPVEALVSALLGIGKVLGIREADALNTQQIMRNVTKSSIERVEYEEEIEEPTGESGKLLPPALLKSSRPTVRTPRVAEKGKKSKKSTPLPGRGRKAR